MTKIIHIVRCNETYLYVGIDFKKAKQIFLDRLATSRATSGPDEKKKIPIVREKAPLSIPISYPGGLGAMLEMTHHVVDLI